MKVAIIVIGDEILLGSVTDTNSGLIARTIAPAGWEVEEVVIVRDDVDQISQAIEHGLKIADIILTTGGIGPTRDDMTRKALLRVFGGELVLDEPTLENVKQVVAKRGFTLNELTAAQARVPSSCRVIQNRFGTAPLMWFEKDKKVLVTLPGVPFETAQAFPQDVFPALRNHFGQTEPIFHSTLIITDYRESELAEKLASIEDSLPHGTHLAYLPEPSIVRLRIDFQNPKDNTTERIKAALGDSVIYENDLPLPAILLELAKQKKVTLGTAESCTGGKISSLLTSIPGSSEVMQGGIVSYSNQVKTHVLGVGNDLILNYGAVSIEVVESMARGAQKALFANLCLATSGIAGPGGGNEMKPVGTVCIAIAYKDKIYSETAHFPGNRERVINQAAARALVLGIKMLCGRL